MLWSLVILDDYINELESLLLRKGNYEVREMNKEGYVLSLGPTANHFFKRKRYDVKNRDMALFDDIWDLNKKRNDIVHHAIFTYKGVLERADEEIRPYIISQKIHNIINKLITTFNIAREENSLIEKKIKDSGLL